MKNSIRLMMSAGSLAALICAGAVAQAQIANLATGLDGSNTLITAGGTSDAHWTVDQAAGGTAAAQVVTSKDPDWYSGWQADGPNSNWIARNASVADNGAAPYTFYRTFDLTGYDMTTVSMTGGWAVDDTGTLALNGIAIANLGSGSWGGLTNFGVAGGSSFFKPGLNTLSITITSDDRFLEAVRLEGTVTGNRASSVVPEPSSIAFIGGLSVTAFAVRRRRSR